MARVFVAIGSNIRPEENVPRALGLLAQRVRLVRVSPFYRSAPVGTDEGGLFWNGVAEVETELPRERLKEDVLRAIEEELGRERTSDPNAPRTIDLDPVLSDGFVDPDVTRYPFVAVPLLDLEPDLVLEEPSRRLHGVVRLMETESLEPLGAVTFPARQRP